jgi:predicted Zn-dependent peptidase
MKIKKLKNGMKLIFIPLDVLTISIGFFIKAGSRFENEKNNGIAHFLEHMMFRGTKNRPSDKLLLEIENLGCSYNAATSYEFTYYEMHGNSKDSIKLLDIMVDLYLNPMFDQKDIEIEKGVVIEEINMNLDKPERTIGNDMYELIFNGSGLGRTIVGSKENIMNIKREDLIDFRKKYYTPTNTIVCIAGKFKYDLMKQLLYDTFDHLPRSEIYIDKQFQSHQTIPEISIKYDDTIKQSLIMFGFRSVGVTDKRAYHLDLLASILSGGSMSRLFQLLRTKMGVSYFNHSTQDTNTDCGVFRVYMGIENERVNEVISAVMNEFKKLRKELVTKEELERVKKLYETGYLFRLETPKDYMIHYGLGHLFYGDDMLDIKDELEIYRNITKEEILKICKDFFVLERLNIAIYGSVDKEKLLDSLDILE